MSDEILWEYEEESASDCAIWSVYDQHGDRLTAPYIGKADAILIAAAPDLLEALDDMLAMIYEGIPKDEWPAIQAKAKAAIAKAKAA